MVSRNDIVSTFTFEFDGKGGVKNLPAKESVKKSRSKKRIFWQHFDYMDQEAVKMLYDDYKLDDDIVEALTELETRPRYFTHDNGLLIIMRGMDKTAKNHDDNMVSLRAWIDDEKIITFSHKTIKGFDVVINHLLNGKGPKTPIGCFMELANNISEEIEKTVDNISYKVDLIEADVIKLKTRRDTTIRALISDVRRRIVSIRRYLVPNRDIFASLKLEKIDILKNQHKQECREVYNTLTKAIEDLDYSRDHLAVSYEELQGHLSMHITRIMYKIAIVTMIFMPMSVVTSLLGVNLKGIPFANNDYAFGVLSLILVTICTILVFLFRKLRWI